MAATKIEYEEKIGLIPHGVRVNQVQDLDMNEIKEVVNNNADLITIKADLVNGKVPSSQLPTKVVSLVTPSGVPADGDEWILYTL